jgi:hypothetical protein
MPQFQEVHKYYLFSVPKNTAHCSTAPSDFHLFGLMKDGLQGQHLSDANAVIAVVEKWLAQADDKFNEIAIQCLVQCWRTSTERGGDKAEK